MKASQKLDSNRTIKQKLAVISEKLQKSSIIKDDLINNERMLKLINSLRNAIRSQSEQIFIAEYLSSLPMLTLTLKKYFKNISDLVFAIAGSLKYDYVKPENIIVRYGESGKNCYVLLSGKADILLPRPIKVFMTEKEYIKHLVKLKVFKEEELFLKTINNYKNKKNYMVMESQFLYLNDIINDYTEETSKFSTEPLRRSSNYESLDRRLSEKRKLKSVKFYQDTKKRPKSSKMNSDMAGKRDYFYGSPEASLILDTKESNFRLEVDSALRMNSSKEKPKVNLKRGHESSRSIRNLELKFDIPEEKSLDKSKIARDPRRMGYLKSVLSSLDVLSASKPRIKHLSQGHRSSKDVSKTMSMNFKNSLYNKAIAFKRSRTTFELSPQAISNTANLNSNIKTPKSIKLYSSNLEIRSRRPKSHVPKNPISTNGKNIMDSKKDKDENNFNIAPIKQVVGFIDKASNKKDPDINKTLNRQGESLKDISKAFKAIFEETNKTKSKGNSKNNSPYKTDQKVQGKNKDSPKPNKLIIKNPNNATVSILTSDLKVERENLSERILQQDSFILRRNRAKLNFVEYIDHAKALLKSKSSYIEKLQPITSTKSQQEGHEIEIYEYYTFKTLESGNVFGELALEAEDSKRTATIISKDVCHIGMIDFYTFKNFFQDARSKIKRNYINYFKAMPMFKSISENILEKRFLNLFTYKTCKAGTHLIMQDNVQESYLFLYGGEFEFYINSSMNAIKNMYFKLGEVLSIKEGEHERTLISNKTLRYEEFAKKISFFKIWKTKNSGVLGFSDTVNNNKFIISVRVISPSGGEYFEISKETLQSTFFDENIRSQAEKHALSRKKYLGERLKQIWLNKVQMFKMRHVKELERFYEESRDSQINGNYQRYYTDKPIIYNLQLTEKKNDCIICETGSPNKSNLPKGPSEISFHTHNYFKAGENGKTQNHLEDIQEETKDKTTNIILPSNTYLSYYKQGNSDGVIPELNSVRSKVRYKTEFSIENSNLRLKGNLSELTQDKLGNNSIHKNAIRRSLVVDKSQNTNIMQGINNETKLRASSIMSEFKSSGIVNIKNSLNLSKELSFLRPRVDNITKSYSISTSNARKNLANLKLSQNRKFKYHAIPTLSKNEIQSNYHMRAISNPCGNLEDFSHLVDLKHNERKIIKMDFPLLNYEKAKSLVSYKAYDKKTYDEAMNHLSDYYTINSSIEMLLEKPKPIKLKSNVIDCLSVDTIINSKLKNGSCTSVISDDSRYNGIPIFKGKSITKMNTIETNSVIRNKPNKSILQAYHHHHRRNLSEDKNIVIKRGVNL